MLTSTFRWGNGVSFDSDCGFQTVDGEWLEG